MLKIKINKKIHKHSFQTLHKSDFHFFVLCVGIFLFCISTSFEGRKEKGCPPRSHDCVPNETEFANAHEESQLDVERREKNINHRRTMMMWKNAVKDTWNNRPIEEVRKLIDLQPKVMRAII